MGRSIVAKGKSVQEALEMGLRLLGAEGQEYDIEILQNETKGLFGLGMKPAAVKVTLRESRHDKAESAFVETPEMRLENLLHTLSFEDAGEIISGHAAGSDTHLGYPIEELLGKAWVQDGVIRFLNAPDKYPVVVPDKGIRLFVNGEEQSGNTLLKEGYIVSAELEQETIRPTWEVRVEQDGMEAKLIIKQPGAKVYRRLKETLPQSFLKLSVEETVIPVPIDEKELLEHLSGMGIVYGIDYEKLSKACRSEKAGIFRIAVGDEPKPGKDGYIDSYISIDVKKSFKERSNGTIDFREMMQYPEAELGQVLGVVMPPIPGTPGKSVTGETIEPPEAYPLRVTAGKGVTLLNGYQLVALESGQPQFKMSGRSATVSVIPKLVINNDITMETGNIRYIGDVDINGTVQDAMLVDANGHVYVKGNVNKANVSAGQSILVERNVITSELTAGGDALLASELYGLLEDISDKMKKMIAAIKQLSTVTAFKTSTMSKTGLGPLIKILCEGKLKTLVPVILNFVQKVEAAGNKLDESWHELAEELKRGFIMINASSLRSEADLRNIAGRCERLLEDAKLSYGNKNVFIQAGFVHHSSLYSSGDIFIVGQGCYNSKLYAQGQVQVKGYVRGGEIVAKGDVSLEEAGTKGGVVTAIRVPAEHAVRIKLALEDTLLQIGPITYRFLQDTPNVFARLDQKCMLQLH